MLGLNEHEFVVLGAGQLIGRKGIEDFIEVSKHIPSARFIWAGGRPFGALSEGISRINDKMKEAGENFKYAGNFELEQMPYIYAAADLMLFPSYQENCPLTPIEAAACGMPVIFRNIEEYKVLYENPYISASDLGEFIRLTTRMISDGEFYNEGLNISAQLIIQFDKGAIRKKLMNLYWELSENSKLHAGYQGAPEEISWGLY